MEMYNDDYGAEAATKSSEISKKKVGGAAAAAATGKVGAQPNQNLIKKNTKMKKGIDLGSENSVSLDDGDDKEEW
jgi:transposase